MKAKIKGQGGVKGLLLLHGEKLLMGLGGVTAAALVFFALKAERLPDKYEAEKLQTQVRATKASVESNENNWPRVVREHPDRVREGGKLEERPVVTVEPKVYNPGEFNRTVIQPRIPRTDPALLPAAALGGTGGAGLLVFNDEDALRVQDLKKRQEEAAKERTAAKQQELDQSSGGRRSGSRGAGRRGGREDDRTRGEFDPEHPNRRTVEGFATRGGVQLQGGELVELAHWVAVVARVPVKEQRSLYRDAFQEAMGGFDPDADSPTYVGYYVKRAEVLPGEDISKLDDARWQDIPVYDAKGTPTRVLFGSAMASTTMKNLNERAATEWAQTPTEVVDSRYLDPAGVLAYPLPPLAGRDWGAEATHPDIPLAANSTDEAFEEPIEGAQPTTPLPGAAGEEFANPIQGFGAESRTGAGMPRTNLRTEPRSRETTRPGASRTGGSAAAGYSRSRTGAAGRTQSPTQAGVNAYLLRFFDFTVVPGKQYAYRVQLVMADPNLASHVKPMYLDAKVSERIKKLPKGPDGRILTASTYRRTDWSAPTPPIGVPLDGSVRMAGVQPADEPRVKLLVEAYGKDPKAGNWIQASPPNAEKEREFPRGSVVNFVDDAEFLTENGAYIDKTDSFRFFTGVTVVDMRGGERISGKDKDMTTPSRVLLMDPTGGLSIRHELDDAPEVQAHRDTFAKKRSSDSQPGGSRRGR